MPRTYILLAIMLLAGIHPTTGRHLLETGAAGTGVCADGYRCCSGTKNGKCTTACKETRYACPPQRPTRPPMRKLAEGDAQEVIEDPAAAQVQDVTTAINDAVQAAITSTVHAFSMNDIQPMEFAAAGTGPCPDGYHCCSSVKNGHCTTSCMANRYVCPPTGPKHPLMRKLAEGDAQDANEEPAAAHALDAPTQDARREEVSKAIEAVQAAIQQALDKWNTRAMDTAVAGTGACPDGYRCCSAVKDGKCTTPCKENRFVCPPQPMPYRY